jgi:hypothetical protein
MNDRCLANPTHGAFWEQLEPSEQEFWKGALKTGLTAALRLDDPGTLGAVKRMATAIGQRNDLIRTIETGKLPERIEARRELAEWVLGALLGEEGG